MLSTRDIYVNYGFVILRLEILDLADDTLAIQKLSEDDMFTI